MTSDLAKQAIAQQPTTILRSAAGLLQRKCDCGQHTIAGGDCDSCKKKKFGNLQRAANTHEPLEEVPEIVEETSRMPGQPLDFATRHRMESRFGHDFSSVRVHTDTQAAESARAVHARAYTLGDHVVFGANQYSTATSAGQRLLAHELTHVIQQRSTGSTLPERIAAPSDSRETQAEQSAVAVAAGGMSKVITPASSGPALLRDLATEPPPQVPVQAALTPAQIQRALRYNRASYNEESTRQIQDIVGGPVTGRFEETTVELVALIQRQYGLVPADGKVGPDTYDFLIRELQTAGVAPGDCLTMFQVIGPDALAFFPTVAGSGTINSRFLISARFDPRCKCEDFEYRQFIGGRVELLETAQPGVTPPATSGCATLISAAAGIWAWNMAGCFHIPGGGLPPHMREDGDTAVPAGTGGHRYGHRSGATNSARDRYLPNRATGCIYEALDVPELGPVPATAGDAGDAYDWDVRFRGVIQHRDGTIVSEKWWNLIDTVVIP